MSAALALFWWTGVFFTVAFMHATGENPMKTVSNIFWCALVWPVLLGAELRDALRKQP